MSKKSTGIGVGKKVLASALSAAMVVAFTPAVGIATGSDDTVAYAEDVQTVENAVAQVGNQQYADVNGALTAWGTQGGTLTLLSSVEITSAVSVSSSNAILDLNGKNITLSAKGIFNVLKSGSLKVIDASGQSSGVVSSNGTSLFSLKESASMTLTGGSLKAAGSKYAVQLAMKNANFIMEGGSISGDTYAVYGSNTGISASIFGGEVSNSESSSSGAVNLSGKGCSLTVGSSDNGPDISSVKVSGDGAQFKFFGGTLGKILSSSTIEAAKSDDGGYIFNGSIRSDFSSFAPTGYACEKQNDGTYSLTSNVTAGNAVAKIGEKYYGSAAEAFSALGVGETLVLLKDLNPSDTLTCSAGNCTIDLGSHKISSSSNPAISFNVVGPASTVEIAGGTVETAGSNALKVVSESSALQVKVGENTQLSAKKAPVVLGGGAYVTSTGVNDSVFKDAGNWAVADESGNSRHYGCDGLKFAASASVDGAVTYFGSNATVGTSLRVPGDKKITVDLAKATVAVSNNDALIIDENNTDLTLKNGTLKASSTGTDAVSVKSTGNKLSFEGMTISAGTRTSKSERFGIRTSRDTSNDVTLSATTIEAAGFGIYSESSGKITVSDSTIKGGYDGIQICSGSLEVNDLNTETQIYKNAKTKITGGGKLASINGVNGPLADGAAISVVNRDDCAPLGDVEINGAYLSEYATSYPSVQAYSYDSVAKGVASWDKAGEVVKVNRAIMRTCPENISSLIGDGKSLYIMSGFSFVEAPGIEGYDVEVKLEGGKTAYANSLLNALNSSPDGSTVVLSKDETLSSSFAPTIKGKVALDLGGYTLELQGSSGLTASGNADAVVKNGTLKGVYNNIGSQALTVKDSAKIKLESISIESEFGCGIRIATKTDDNPLKIEDGVSVSGAAAGVILSPYKKGGEKAGVVVDGGTVVGGYYGIAGNGSDGDTSIVIKSGAVKSTGSDGAGIYHPQGGLLVLDGGSIEGAVGVQMCAGNLTIPASSSVKVVANGADASSGKTGDGVVPDGAAISVVNRTGYGALGKVAVDGGEFVSTTSAIHAFAWDGTASSEFDNSGKTIAVSGGAYSTDPKDYVAEGYSVAVNNDASRYLVTKAVNVGANKKLVAGTFSEDMSSYMSGDCYEYAMHDGKTFVVKAKDAAAPANTSGYYWGAADDKGVRSEVAIPYTPVTPPAPTPTPEPTPVAPGTDVSGTDSAGNTVEATVTDNNKTTLPDGTEAAGSVEFKGATAPSGSSEPDKSVEVPATVTANGSTYVVTKIADGAFAGQRQLESVSIPETVVEIGSKAFAGTSISKAVIPAATSTIGAGVFQGCKALESVDIKSSVLTNIPADAFNGTSLGSIDIPATVTSIGARAFKETKLQSIELPKAVTTIEKGTFQNCTELASVASSAKTVDKSAFAGCGSLKTVSLPKAAEVGSYAFSGTALKSISLRKVETIGANAFKNAAKLKTLTTGSKLEGIGSKALAGAKNLKVLTVTSKRLTKKGVKNSLKGSSVRKVEVAVSGSKSTLSKYVAKYGKIFKKSNSGKSVSVVPAKKKQK